MTASIHQLSLPGAILARGFWLYVWEVTTANGQLWLYVGRTGDSSSPNAQSPFARLSQHLSQNAKGNALRRHLKSRGIDPNTCDSFVLTAYGPILAEERTMERHRPQRDIMAGLEKGLWEAFERSGYSMLNKVVSRKGVDRELLRGILQCFVEKFPNLKIE